MKLETALKIPHTVMQLTKLTGLSRGAVLAALRTHASKIRRVGVKKTRGHTGPAPALYQLEEGVVMTHRARAKAPKRLLVYPRTKVTLKQLAAGTAATTAVVNGGGVSAQ